MHLGKEAESTRLRGTGRQKAEAFGAANETARDQVVEDVDNPLSGEGREAAGGWSIESAVCKLPMTLGEIRRTVHQNPTTALVRRPHQNTWVRQQGIELRPLRGRQVIMMRTGMGGTEKMVRFTQKQAGNTENVLRN